LLCKRQTGSSSRAQFRGNSTKGMLARSMMLAVGAWMGLAASAYSADYTIGISIWDVSNNPSSVPIIAGMGRGGQSKRASKSS